MAQPTNFNRSADYSDDAANSTGGRTTIDPTKLDAEFDAVETTLDGVLTNLALIQRDDGKIRDGKVELHTLSAQVKALIAAAGATIRGDWVTATGYSVNDVVTESGATYICATAHTSGVFATDLAADRWVLLMSAPSALSAAGVSSTPAGSLSSNNVQDALNELDGDVTALAATVGAISALPLAGGTMTGKITLDGNPTAALHAASKQYVDDALDGALVCAGYFEFVSSTQLRLSRYGGKRIFIDGAWYDIPAAGALLSNSGLSANTVYRVYAYVNTGTVTLEASTTARATDTTYGHQIKNGDASRTLVGMCRTNASAQFYDMSADIGVLSYYNRRHKMAYRAGPTSGSFVTVSGSYVAVSPFTAVNWLSWNEDVADLRVQGLGYATSGALNAAAVPGVDGVASGVASRGSAHAANYYISWSALQQSWYSEGNHTLDARVVTNGASLTISTNGIYAIVSIMG